MMKSTKFLAALAGVAMFAACAEEEIVKIENASQPMNEVVGARLVGTDVSIITDDMSATRYAGGENKWEAGDRIGLGWMLNNDNPTEEQLEGTKLANSKIWANHMFDTNDAGKTWISKGNLYEGWYFAYYPWAYQAKPGVAKSYELNPAMIGQGAAKHKSQTLYLSQRQFIDADSDLDQETGTLESSFKMNQAVKFIQVTAKAKAGSIFANKEAELSQLQITDVEINVGKDNNIFAKKVDVRGAALPVKVEYAADATAEEKAATDMLNLKNFREALKDVWVEKETSSVLSRNVEAANLLVSTNPKEDGKNVNVYFNVIAKEAVLEAEKITVTFKATDNAKFVINYATASETNKAAIDALVAAYAKDGALSTFNDLDKEGNPEKDLRHLALEFELCPNDFVTDFTDIPDFPAWEKAVNLVNALGRTSEQFHITGAIDFEDAILMPTSCALTVVAGNDGDKKANEQTMYLQLSGTHNAEAWPAKLNSEAVRVKVAKEAVVNHAQIIEATNIVNNGTLNVDKGETLGRDGYTLYNLGTINLLGMYSKVTTVDNTNGEINLVYGGYVTLSTKSNPGKNSGKIAYIVTKDDVEKPTRIQNVINTTNNTSGNYALVNILKFESENVKEFDFTLPDGKTDDVEDPYNPIPGDKWDPAAIKSLENVSLVIDNVVVKSTIKVTVLNVTMTGADAKLQNIDFNGFLDVTDGEVATAVVKGGVKAKNSKITATEIKNGVNADNSTISATSIEGAVNATNSAITTTGNITGAVTANGGSITAATVNASTANVELTDVEVVASEITAANVVLKGETSITNAVINGNVNVQTGVANLTNVRINGTLTIAQGAKVVLSNEQATNITNVVNNGTLVSNNDINVENVDLNIGSTTTLDSDAETLGFDKVLWYTGTYKFYQMTLNGTVSQFAAAQLIQEIADAEAGATVTLKGDVELSEALTISKDVVLNLNGKKVTSAGDAFEVTQGTLTITGNGTVEAGEGGAFVAVWANGGNVVIENGSFSVGTDAEGKCNDCIYAKGGTITINGGTYTHSGTDSTKGGAVVNAHNTVANSKVIVNGGTFTGHQIKEEGDITAGRVVWNIQ